MRSVSSAVCWEGTIRQLRISLQTELDEDNY